MEVKIPASPPPSSLATSWWQLSKTL
jgi:hypothetical protein